MDLVLRAKQPVAKCGHAWRERTDIALGDAGEARIPWFRDHPDCRLFLEPQEPPPIRRILLGEKKIPEEVPAGTNPRRPMTGWWRKVWQESVKVPIDSNAPEVWILDDEAYYRTFDVFEDSPALFYVFSELAATQEAIVTFANSYGPLYLNDDRPDTLAEWKWAIGAIRTWVKHWESVRDRRGKEREEFERMVALLRSPVFARVVTCLEKEPHRPLRLYVEPECFHDALWLQFALAVMGNKEYRRCEWCGRPMEVSPERSGKGRRGRSDRHFCMDTCRQKAYLRRRETAAKMREEGKKLREIAKVVKTDLDTLKKWLGEVKSCHENDAGAVRVQSTSAMMERGAGRSPPATTPRAGAVGG